MSNNIFKEIEFAPDGVREIANKYWEELFRPDSRERNLYDGRNSANQQMQTAKAELGWKKNPNVSLKQDNTRVVKPPHLLPERRIDKTLPELLVPLKVPPELRRRQQERALSYMSEANDPIVQDVKQRQADRKVQARSMTQANKTEMNNLANLALWTGGAALAGLGLYTLPIITISGGVGGYLGNELGDWALRKVTDNKYNNWGELMENITEGYIRADNGQYLNPFAWLGGSAGAKGLPYKFRVATYNNKNPFGYGNDISDKVSGIKPVKIEIANVFKDFLNPFSWRPKDTPYWKAALQSAENGSIPFIGNIPAGAAAEFRDMIFRKALKFPEGKNGTIFVDNGDGTFGINMEKANSIRRQWGGSDYEPHMFVGEEPKFLTPNHIKFLTADDLAGVGGNAQGEVIYDPITGQTKGVMTDVWDLQPFIDDRTVWKWGSEHIPGLKKMEVLKQIGGETPTQRFVIDNPQLYYGH